MERSYSMIVGFQLTMARQWVETIAAVTSCYAAALDPRPDLAVPADPRKQLYWWWW